MNHAVLFRVSVPISGLKPDFYKTYSHSKHKTISIRNIQILKITNKLLKVQRDMRFLITVSDFLVKKNAFIFTSLQQGYRKQPPSYERRFKIPKW